VRALLAKHITQPAPLVAAAVPGLSTKLGDAVHRCLAKSPAERFASAEELADAIGGALTARSETPAPIRIFTKKSSEITQSLAFISYLQLFLAAFGTAASITPDKLGANVLLGLAAIPFVAWPFLAAGMLAQIRGLLKSGYTRDDLAARWGRELQHDQEERAVEHGRSAATFERVSRWAIPVGAAAAIVSAPMRYVWSLGGVGTMVGALGWGTMMVGGLVHLWEYDLRTSLSR